MYLNESIINYLAGKDMIKKLPISGKINGTVTFIHFKNIYEMINTEQAEEVIKFINYIFTNILVFTDTPYVQKNVNKFIGSSLISVSFDSNHLYNSIDSCIKIRSSFNKFINKSPTNLSIQPEISMGVCTGNMIYGYVGGISLGFKDHLILGRLIDTAWTLSMKASVNEILICDHTKKLITQHFEFDKRGEIELLDQEHTVQTYSVKGHIKSNFEI